MKRKIIYLIVIIALFIPSFIAVKSYMEAQRAPAGIKTAVSIKIDDIDGNSFFFEKEQDGDEAEDLIAFFIDINSRATQLVALPDSTAGQKFFHVTMSTNVKDESYQYYMSVTPGLCYFVNPDGVPYQLTEEDAGKFLESKYAESLYDNSKQPVLTVSNEFTVAPSVSVWKYKNYTGGFTDADTSRFISTDKQSFSIVGGLSLSFDLLPDIYNVKITDSSDNVLYDDIGENLTSLKLEETETVSVSINATWYEDSKRDYQGSSEYSFDATISAPATFYVIDPEVMDGDFLSITAQGVPDPAKIKFSSTPEIDASPIFYADGDYSQGLLPIPSGTAAGDYVLNLTYGGASQDINLKIVERNVNDAYITVSDAMIAENRSEAALAEFDELVGLMAQEASSERYWDGYFIDGAGVDSILTRGFGRKIIINDDPEMSYISNGIDFMLGAGSNVTAANAGEVVYTGETSFTGNIVVIEHGFGLKTWYWNLGEISVEKGVKVSQGDKIGTSGTSGFNGGSAGFHLAMSVGDTFVCPYDTWSDGEGGVLMHGVFEKNTSN